MQDGASCHPSKVATEFLKENKISVLEWPGNSSDLNPVENLWTDMKDVRRKQTITLHVEEYTFIKFQMLMYNAFGEKTHI